MLTVLYVGSFGVISTSRQRFEALQAIGAEVARVDGEWPAPWKNLAARVGNRLLGFPVQHRAVARGLVQRAAAVRPDLVWFDKAVFVDGRTLDEVRRISNPVLVHYNPDDPFGHAAGFWSTFVRAIPRYDIHFVPKPANVQEYLDRGARCVLPYDRGFCPRVHCPPSVEHPRWGEFATRVAFTGSYERERAESIGRLVEAGVGVTIRGSLWQRAANWSRLQQYFQGGAVAGDEYALALGAPQITLHFLRHANRDEQDSRTFEIPACGGFMMAEWSQRHAELFEEDREAVFFRDDTELVEKVKHYLERPEECAAIAVRGRARALAGGYDYRSRMRDLVGKATRAAGREDLLERWPPLAVP